MRFRRIASAAISIVAIFVEPTHGQTEGLPRLFQSGAALADVLIGAAKLNDGIVNLGEDVNICVAPGFGYIDSVARRLFPGTEIQFVESNESDVAWYVIILNTNERIEIYEISNTILKWVIDEAEIANKLVSCPKRMLINQSKSDEDLIVRFER